MVQIETYLQLFIYFRVYILSVFVYFWPSLSSASITVTLILLLVILSTFLIFFWACMVQIKTYSQLFIYFRVYILSVFVYFWPSLSTASITVTLILLLVILSTF